MAKPSRIKQQPLHNQIAIVAGGSMGIGKETAKEIARLGGSVCIIARRHQPLDATKREIQELLQWDNQFVEILACDATDRNKLEPMFIQFIEKYGTPDILINAVGYAHPQYIQKLTLEDFRENMDTNYYGQLVPLLILLPFFLKAQKGHIVLISSMMGFFGIMGYATYAPTKFALAGLAEVLRHELKPHHIIVTILYPPDTDTPGFENENFTKPPECTLISQSARLMKPEQVAEELVEGMLRKKFEILPGESGLYWRLFRFFPGLVRGVIDDKYRKAGIRNHPSPIA